MSFGVVVPNRFPDIIAPLMVSIRALIPEPKPRIVIVADGHDRDYGFEKILYPKEQFVFAKSANIGIRHLGSGDVILINDDCTLIEHDFFRKLDFIAHFNPRIGILSPLIQGGVGNLFQSLHHKTERWKHRESVKLDCGFPLCFPCVWIKRSMLEEIGLLDESFVTYGGEDIEICQRAKRAGWFSAITSLLVVKHGNGSPINRASGRGKSFSMSYNRTYKWD